MDDKLRKGIVRLQEGLAEKKNVKLNMMIGLDGFVDEILHVVSQRSDFNNYTRINTIEEFGNRVLKAAGLSTNMEMVSINVKLGGNGPILTNALLEYGAAVTYVGALGSPDIHPVFKDMASKSSAVYSLCDPGYTNAMEFEDGKLLMGKLTTINTISWERFKEVVGSVEAIAGILDKCDLLGMENWTMIPYMSKVWEGIINEVFPLLKPRAEKPLAFFDLADPEKRTAEDIREAMKLIAKFEDKYKSILGLNEKELSEISSAYGLTVDKTLPRDEMLQKATVALYNKLGIYCLVVHPTREAVACVNGEYYHTDGPFCAKPVLTTGAGDNFNAGFCMGQSLGLDPQSSLVMGVATSGFYVRNAKSPTMDDVTAFLRDWLEGAV